MTAPSRAAAAAGFALTLAALLAIYLPGLGNALVFDDGYLGTGELLQHYASPFELRERWLSYGSFVWLNDLLGAGWWKQRLFNVILHCCTVVALWGLYREILRCIETPRDEAPLTEGEVRPAPAPLHDSPALAVAIAVFALNPVAVYAVAYLIQRSILMATLFSVLGLWVFARALAARRPWMHAAAALCYALAVMSKEYAILVPLAAVPLYILVARPSAVRLASIAGVGAALTAIAAFFLAKRYGQILGQPFDEYSHIYLEQLARLQPGADGNAWLLSIVNQAYLFFHYGLRWFLPASEWMSINLRPPFPLTWHSFPHVLGPIGYAALIVGGFWLLLRHRDWRALLGISLLLPALLFATEFATVWVQDPFVLYRSYLWAIGVPGIVFLLVHGPSVRVLAVVGLVVASLLVWQALDRVFSLASVERAWSDAIRKLPNDPRSVGRWFPYLNRGTFYVEQNQFQLAIRDFEASAALGDLGMGSFNLGAVLAARGQHAEALRHFAEAEKQGYRLYNLPFQRGLSLAALGRPQEAYAQFQATRAMSPPSPTRELLYLAQARLAMQLGKPDEALEALRQLAQVEPTNREGQFLLAMAHLMKNEHTRAREVADGLVGGDPDARALYARALANYGLKRKDEALADIEGALRLEPKNPNLREWQAKIKAMP